MNDGWKSTEKARLIKLKYCEKYENQNINVCFICQNFWDEAWVEVPVV